MNDLFEFLPHVPLLYKKRGRILQNDKCAGAVCLAEYENLLSL